MVMILEEVVLLKIIRSENACACSIRLFCVACLLLFASACGDLHISRNIEQERDSGDSRKEIREEIREEIKKLSCEESGKFEGKPCD